MTRPVALTIAGSDSGGGAGIQMDLRVMTQLGCCGTTALTALTAQNLRGVSDVHEVPVAHVRAQVRAVLEGFDVRAAKTGMLWSAQTVRAVAELAREVPALVVDPVMVAATGDRLLRDEAVRVYREELLPRCAVATPNLDEAAVLLGRGSLAEADLDDVARTLGGELGCSVLLKGGHMQGDPVDRLWHGGSITRWKHARVTGVNSHGSGCALSAAIASHLAHGAPVGEACERAVGWLEGAFQRPVEVGDDRLLGVE